MIACTSPAPSARSMPFRISRPSTATCRFLISSNAMIPNLSADAAFQADAEQLLGLDGELHRQRLQNFLAKSVDDQRHGLLLAEAPLAAIEQLVFTDLAGRRLVLDARPRIPGF